MLTRWSDMSTKEKCELSCITIASLFLLVAAVACSVLAGINFPSYKSFSDNDERAESREPGIAYIVGIAVCGTLFSFVIKSH